MIFIGCVFLGQPVGIVAQVYRLKLTQFKYSPLQGSTFNVIMLASVCRSTMACTTSWTVIIRMYFSSKGDTAHSER